MGLDAFHYFFYYFFKIYYHFRKITIYLPNLNHIICNLSIQCRMPVRCKYWFPFTCSGHNETPMSDECGSFHMKRLLVLIGRKWKLQFW